MRWENRDIVFVLLSFAFESLYAHLRIRVYRTTRLVWCFIVTMFVLSKVHSSWTSIYSLHQDSSRTHQTCMSGNPPSYITQAESMWAKGQCTSHVTGMHVKCFLRKWLWYMGPEALAHQNCVTVFDHQIDVEDKDFQKRNHLYEVYCRSFITSLSFELPSFWYTVLSIRMLLVSYTKDSICPEVCNSQLALRPLLSRFLSLSTKVAVPFPDLQVVKVFTPRPPHPFAFITLLSSYREVNNLLASRKHKF